MSRYSNTERLGVIETDRIVTKYLGWIFREQPIIDVGLDALIEQSEEGEPKGRLQVRFFSICGEFYYFSDRAGFIRDLFQGEAVAFLHDGWGVVFIAPVGTG